MRGSISQLRWDQRMISIKPVPAPDERGDVVQVEFVREVSPPRLVMPLSRLQLDSYSRWRITPGTMPASVVIDIPQCPF